MNTAPYTAPLPLQPEVVTSPWILALRPATLGLLATLAVALISAAALLQPQAAAAETAMVSAVIGG